MTNSSGIVLPEEIARHTAVAAKTDARGLQFAPHNITVKAAPSGRWTLRDRAAQRRLALR